MVVQPRTKESERIEALRAYDVLDTPPEPAFDDVVRMTSYLCGTPIAVISLVDEHRQWYKAKIGVEAAETPREHSFCTHAILDPTKVMIVPDATRDPRFADSPLVTGPPHIRFYAGAPLVTPSGAAIGSLCAIDRRPRTLDDEQIEMLRALSRVVIAQLELRSSVAAMGGVLAERERYVEQLERYQKQLEEASVRLDALSATDELTGIANRRTFQARLEDEVAAARRYRRPFALVLVDVDHFKAINDQFGHPAGDEVLRRVARLLKDSVRGHDLVARYGGEEFAILLPAAGREATLVIAERCRRAIERAEWPDRPVTASLGAAILEDLRGGATEILAAADKALYASKHDGRNRTTVAAEPGAPAIAAGRTARARRSARYDA